MRNRHRQKNITNNMKPKGDYKNVFNENNIFLVSWLTTRISTIIPNFMLFQWKCGRHQSSFQSEKFHILKKKKQGNNPIFQIEVSALYLDEKIDFFDNSVKHHAVNHIWESLVFYSIFQLSIPKTLERKNRKKTHPTKSNYFLYVLKNEM